jgi:hypothetical protein
MPNGLHNRATVLGRTDGLCPSWEGEKRLIQIEVVHIMGGSGQMLQNHQAIYQKLKFISVNTISSRIIYNTTLR